MSVSMPAVAIRCAFITAPRTWVYTYPTGSGTCFQSFYSVMLPRNAPTLAIRYPLCPIQANMCGTYSALPSCTPLWRRMQ